MRGVVTPIVNDVQNLGADDSAKDYQNPEVPGMFGIDALLFGIADTDPQPDQDSQRYQEAVGRQAEIAYMKKSWEHESLY